MERLFDNVNVCPFEPTSKSGVYAICISNRIEDRHKYGENEIVLYIGSSKNINSRLRNCNHPYERCLNIFTDKLVYYKEIECINYEEVELQLINIYQPLLNKKTH